MTWEDPQLETNEETIIEQILLGLAARLPGWVPVEGAPEVALAEEFGRETAVTNALAIEVARLAVAGFAQTVFGLVPRQGAAAILPDVELGTVVQFRPDGSSPAPGETLDLAVDLPAGFTIVADQIAFTTLADVVETITLTASDLPDPEAPPSPENKPSFLGALHIEMTATVPGTAGNVPAGTPATIITATGVFSVAGINVDGVGGVEEETLLDYLDRVTDYLATLRPGGARAQDLATLARTVSGVHRAMGVDLLDPEEVDPQERTATIFAIDATGHPVAGSTQSALQAQLDAAREVNFNLFLSEPTYTPVAVEVSITTDPGASEGATHTAVTAAVTALIDPSAWGNSAEDDRAWSEKTTLRALDVAVAAAQVPGVASVISVTVNGDAVETALVGPAALPAPLDALVDPSTVTVIIPGPGT